MADPVFYEKPSGDFAIDVNSRGETREFFVNNVEERDAAEALIYANTPTTSGALIRKSVKGTRQGPACWSVTVEYGTGERSQTVGINPPDPQEIGDTDPLGVEWSFESTAQTAHITQAVKTKYRRMAGDHVGGPNNRPDFIGRGPDEYRAIGLTKDRVEGCDIYAPSFTFTISHNRPFVNLAYINAALYGLVGKTNKEQFYIFDPGEVLYLGCTGNQTQGKQWRLSHKFAASPNQRNLSFPAESGSTVDNIVIPFKGGWEYVWVSYKFKEVAWGTEKILMQVPNVVYVQQVYGSGDFNLLGVGGARGAVARRRERQRGPGVRWIPEWGVPGDDFGAPVIRPWGGGDDESGEFSDIGGEG